MRSVWIICTNLVRKNLEKTGMNGLSGILLRDSVGQVLEVTGVCEGEIRTVSVEAGYQSRIDVHDMRFTLSCCSNCPCVDCGIPCNIEIYRILESETSLDIIEKVIQMAHEPLFNLEAMTFHCASYTAALYIP